MSLASAWEDHADDRRRRAVPDARGRGGDAAALFANGMAITALTEGGDGTVPWLLALRADKLSRKRGSSFPASRSRSRGRT